MEIGGLLSKYITKEIVEHPGVIVLGISIGLFTLGSTINSSFFPFVTADEFQNKNTIMEKAFIDHVMKSEQQFRELRLGQCDLLFTLEKSTIEGNLRVVEKEIYEIERAINSGNQTERDVARLLQLRTDKSILERKLTVIVSEPPCKEKI